MGYDVEAIPHVSHHPRSGHVPSTPLETIQKNKAKSWTIGIWRIYPGWPPPIDGQIINSWVNPKWNNLYIHMWSLRVQHLGGFGGPEIESHAPRGRRRAELLVLEYTKKSWPMEDNAARRGGQSQLSMAAFRDLSWYPVRLNEDMIRQITGSDGW